MSEHVKVITTGGVRTLILDRAAKRNALTEEMYGALADALGEAEGDDAIRAVILRGEGATFTAGNDLGDFTRVAMGGAPPQQVGRFLAALVGASKPLVAAVQGHAVGVGTTLLLHCDQVVLAEDARLSAPFVSLALVPEAGSSLLLPARIGHARAFSMFALGEVVDAATALGWGLANQVVPAGELVAAAEAIGQRLARLPLGALVATKRLMRPRGAIAAQMEVERGVFVERLATAEAREAFTAFAERRPPDFTRVS